MENKVMDNSSYHNANHQTMHPEKRGKYQKSLGRCSIIMGLFLNIGTAFFAYQYFSVHGDASASYSASLGSTFALGCYLLFIAIPVGLIVDIASIIYMIVIREKLVTSAKSLFLMGIILCLFPVLYLISLR